MDMTKIINDIEKVHPMKQIFIASVEWNVSIHVWLYATNRTLYLL